MAAAIAASKQAKHKMKEKGESRKRQLTPFGRSSRSVLDASDETYKVGEELRKLVAGMLNRKTVKDIQGSRRKFLKCW